jgi:hypothetical protein
MMLRTLCCLLFSIGLTTIAWPQTGCKGLTFFYEGCGYVDPIACSALPYVQSFVSTCGDTNCVAIPQFPFKECQRGPEFRAANKSADGILPSSTGGYSTFTSTSCVYCLERRVCAGCSPTNLCIGAIDLFGNGLWDEVKTFAVYHKFTPFEPCSL